MNCISKLASTYNDHDVMHPLLMEAVDILWKPVPFIRIDREIKVLIHVLDIIPLCIQWNLVVLHALINLLHLFDCAIAPATKMEAK